MKFFKGFLKWILAGILGLIAGLLVIIFVSDYLIAYPLALRLVILAVIVMTNALFSRLFLKRTWLLFQVVLTFIANTISIFTLDRFFQSEYQFDFVSAITGFQDFSNIEIPSIRDGSQLLFILLVSLPVLLPFRRKKPRLKASKTQKKGSLKADLANGWKTFVYQVNPVNWGVWSKLKGTSRANARQASRSVSTPVAPPLQVTPRKTTVARVKSNGRKTPLIKSTKNKVRLPGRLFHANGNNDVKLTGTEDHVCPYCLEEIHPGDPLGVVICKECGTWHHQDCWDLTGSCGVAHRNQL